MKRVALLLASMVLVFASMAAMAEETPKAVHDLAKNELAAYGADAVIVAAVKEQNARKISLEAIKAEDQKWKGHAGTADYMRALQTNTCGQRITAILESRDYFIEIFVMDNQGANVCMTDKTSDYWQGDEAKFQKSFADGAGAVFVDDVEFDDSAQAYLSQVSVPVLDHGKAIGAITFGVDVDKVE